MTPHIGTSLPFKADNSGLCAAKSAERLPERLVEFGLGTMCPSPVTVFAVSGNFAIEV